jgi:predicted RNase H-like HicB family nuclease
MKREDELLLHALIEREGDRHSALCPEVDVASEGATPEEAQANLREAVTGYLGTVFDNGFQDRLFPRLAPHSEWRRFFEAQLRQQPGTVRDLVQLQQVAYA